MAADIHLIRDHVSAAWGGPVLHELERYISVPALSPAFDPAWEANGHLRAVVDQARAWCAARAVEGLSIEVHELAGRTPLLLLEVAPFDGVRSAPDGGGRAEQGTVLLYGHLDKQPEMAGWRAGLGPWTPVVEGDRLYGRGGADDGYAVFAAMTAIEALQRAGGRHGRLVVLVETSEESGSSDLPAHVDVLAERLGAVELVVCLDSGCADYERMWLTTSLRGLVNDTVTVQVLTEGVHSGAASGVVPSSFRLLRALLDRIEDAATGEVRLASAQVDIPPHRQAEAHAMAAALGPDALEGFPFAGSTRPTTADIGEALLRRTWRPALSVIGADGLPATAAAGNVLRPSTSLRLSLRLPPTADAAAVHDELRAVLAHDPPSRARISFDRPDVAGGWDAPQTAPWLAEALAAASRSEFSQPPGSMGEGGSIPFMGMLGQRFPDAQFVVTGVLGPGSNAHGPNEFLHLPMAERLTRCIARLLEAAANRTA